MLSFTIEGGKKLQPVSSVEQIILSQMVVKPDCMAMCWILYICGNGTETAERLKDCVAHYFFFPI